ncbi:hypothetical protein EW120_20235, partial [Vibrio cholerae]|nr:hypothetical protein [Vibrio cholerae]
SKNIIKNEITSKKLVILKVFLSLNHGSKVSMKSSEIWNLLPWTGDVNNNQIKNISHMEKLLYL